SRGSRSAAPWPKARIRPRCRLCPNGRFRDSIRQRPPASSRSQPAPRATHPPVTASVAPECLVASAERPVAGKPQSEPPAGEVHSIRHAAMIDPGCAGFLDEAIAAFNDDADMAAPLKVGFFDPFQRIRDSSETDRLHQVALGDVM